MPSRIRKLPRSARSTTPYCNMFAFRHVVCQLPSPSQGRGWFGAKTAIVESSSRGSAEAARTASSNARTVEAAAPSCACARAARTPSSPKGRPSAAGGPSRCRAARRRARRAAAEGPPGKSPARPPGGRRARRETPPSRQDAGAACRRCPRRARHPGRRRDLLEPRLRLGRQQLHRRVEDPLDVLFRVRAAASTARRCRAHVRAGRERSPTLEYQW